MELLELFETSDLSEQENNYLNQCEKVIQEGIKTFKEVGQALLEIRENRLYRKDFKTFDEYCREKWGINKSQTYRLIEATKIYNNISPMGEVSPTSERQIRPLSKLEPELQREVWKEATEKTIKPTGEIVKELVKDAEKLNALVKELKNNNLMVFNSESELMTYAKSKLTSFNLLIDKLKTAESNELKLESNLDKMENEKIKLEYELQNTKKELSKLQALNINEDKILATMQRLQEFEAREKDLSEHIRLSNEMAKLIVEAREFFVNHAIRINTITVTPESRHNVRQMSAEVIKLVEDWLWVFRSQFSVQSNSIIKLEE